MKRRLTLTKSILAIVGLTFILSSCSSWRYNNPRVSVEKETTPYVNQEVVLPVQLAASPEADVMEDRILEHGTVNDPRLSNTYPGNTQLTNENKQNSPVVLTINHAKNNTSLKLFSDHVKRQGNHSCKTKSVEKTALSGWVRIMVLLFVIGFILLLVGIFLSVFIYGGFWWLFYAFGALCILAGFVILILGLVGLI